ncbi:MAG: hypothetical protein HGB17_10710 [Syntrophobacteraceae bacterium]|nr:hypothetical protein [Syntrophobacteraceae bacterium]
MGKDTSKLNMLLALIFFCLAAFGSRVLPVHAAEDGSFAGTWVANGSKEVLALGSERETALFRLSGVVNLDQKIGKTGDYWSECIGLADTETGSDIRCVWRGLEGEEVYLILKGTRMETGSSITGSFHGGAGPAKGITGTVRFTWSMMSFKQATHEMGIGGFSNDLSGTYSIP